MRSPTTNTSGWPGSEQSGLHLDAPGAVDGGAGALGQQPPERRGLHAGRPDLGARLDAVALDVEAGLVDADDPGAEAHLDAQPLEVALRPPAQPLRVAGEHGVQRVEQHDPRAVAGSKRRKLSPQRAA